MALIVVIVAVLVVLAFVGVTIAVGVSLATANSHELASSNAASQWRTAVIIRVIGLAVGAVVAFLLYKFTAMEQALPTSALVTASGFALGVWLSERFVVAPRKQGEHTAGMKARSLKSYAPVFPMVLAGTGTVLLAGSLVFSTLTADNSTDPITGKSGCKFTVATDTMTCSSSPYPGSHYSVALFAALAVLIILAFAALVQVAHRTSGYGATHARDEALRTSSIRMVLGVYSAAVFATLAGVSLLINIGLGVSDCYARNAGTVGATDRLPGWITSAQSLYGGIMFLSVIAVVVSLAVAFMPARAKEDRGAFTNPQGR